MKTFIQRFGKKILGVLHGFDRIRFRGTRRFLANVLGMVRFLWQRQVLLKDFKAFAGNITAQVRQAAEEVAVRQGRPVVYLRNGDMDKDAWARQVAQRDGIRQGLIGVLKSVERCWSYEVRPNRAKKKLELHGEPSKCLHYYHYFQDADVGLVYVRLQTWFPFNVHVGMNGREWLARQMDRAGMSFRRRDNCFTWVEDWARAQHLLDEQLRTNWPALLDGLLTQANPALAIVDPQAAPYYWSMDQGEWASDLALAAPAALAALAPRLFRHAWLNFDSGDVMRFLGSKAVTERGPHGNFEGEVVTDLKRRPEGTRIKHRLNRNWIKMYDKQGSVLRVETVINDPRDMKVYRTKEGDDRGEKAWRRLRKGVADVHRRAEISQAANERYGEALASVDDSRSLAELAETVCQPVTWQGKRARALNPLAAEDARLLQAVNRGEFAINGFRNRDLRALWFDNATKPPEPAEQRRQAGAITRKLRLLRAHGLIHKIPKTHRYQISPHGREIINALLAARQTSTAKLTEAA
jgi:hypothetical protein